MRLGPKEALPHLPHIDNVADKVENVAAHGVQKIQQMIGAAAAEAEMYIGNPDGPKG
ncbi:hypothetical protein YTPLAS18_10710 [Nitrospira sp.]|nr:hypothetical protein YTPLAS18_10710 [Nitrospira sp.]